MREHGRIYLRVSLQDPFGICDSEAMLSAPDLFIFNATDSRVPVASFKGLGSSPETVVKL